MTTSWQLLTVAAVESYCKKRFVPHGKKTCQTLRDARGF